MKLAVFTLLGIILNSGLVAQEYPVKIRPNSNVLNSELAFNSNYKLHTRKLPSLHKVRLDSLLDTDSERSVSLLHYQNRDYYKLHEKRNIKVYKKLKNSESVLSITNEKANLETQDGIKKKGYYYIIQSGPLKKLNYKNLIQDLQGNPESIKLLKEAKKIQTTNTIFYSAISAMLIGGVIHTFSKIEQQGDNPSQQGSVISPYFIAGGLLVTIPLFKSGTKNSKLIQAIQAY